VKASAVNSQAEVLVVKTLAQAAAAAAEQAATDGADAGGIGAPKAMCAADQSHAQRTEKLVAFGGLHLGKP